MGGLQGKERRSYGPGRRATDQTTQGAMPWVRVLLLAIALVITAYAVLVIRDDSRPRREAEAMRIEALGLEARLAATRIEARLAATAGAMTLAARDLSERPDQAVEALDRARAVAPSPCSITTETSSPRSAARPTLQPPASRWAPTPSATTPCPAVAPSTTAAPLSLARPCRRSTPG
jgi:two-component system cell cycle sensor histidine kinase PleC